MIKNFTFNETPGLNVDVPDNASPVIFLNLMLTGDLLNVLVQKTNEYAEKIINSTRLLRRGCLWNNWKNVNFDEMRKFIVILTSMGLYPHTISRVTIFCTRTNISLLY